MGTRKILAFLYLLDVVLEAVVSVTQRVVLQVQLQVVSAQEQGETNLSANHCKSCKEILHEDGDFNWLLKVAHRHGVDRQTRLETIIRILHIT